MMVNSGVSVVTESGAVGIGMVIASVDGSIIVVVVAVVLTGLVGMVVKCDVSMDGSHLSHPCGAVCSP